MLVICGSLGVSGRLPSGNALWLSVVFTRNGGAGVLERLVVGVLVLLVSIVKTTKEQTIKSHPGKYVGLFLAMTKWIYLPSNSGSATFTKGFSQEP